MLHGCGACLGCRDQACKGLGPVAGGGLGAARVSGGWVGCLGFRVIF